MDYNKIFPTALVVLDLGAAIVYWVTTKDIRKVVYWISAAVLTASVTY